MLLNIILRCLETVVYFLYFDPQNQPVFSVHSRVNKTASKHLK